MKKLLKLGIVNLFTTIRLLGIFFLVPCYFWYNGKVLAITNIICFLTDFFDGFLARLFKASSFFGSLYDGLTDKAFIIVNFFILFLVTPLSLIPIFLEISIMIIQYIRFRKKLNVRSNLLGKIKMWLIGITIISSNLFIFYSSSKVVYINYLLIFVILMEVMTIISYCCDFKDIQNKNVKEFTEKQKRKISKMSFKELLFDYEFYMEFKNERIMEILKVKFKKG